MKRKLISKLKDTKKFANIEILYWKIIKTFEQIIENSDDSWKSLFQEILQINIFSLQCVSE